jgi:hypothetical protein
VGLPVRPAKSRDGQARQAEPPEGPGHSPPVCLGGSGNPLAGPYRAALRRTAKSVLGSGGSRLRKI